MIGTVDLVDPLATAPGSSYAEPHDLRSDFPASSAGAEWIDEVNAEARAVLADAPVDAIGHVDWRGGNVVVADGQLAAIYDWDSAAQGSEAMLVGMASATWSLAWAWGRAVHRDVASTAAFVVSVTAPDHQEDDSRRSVPICEKCEERLVRLMIGLGHAHDDAVARC